MCGIIGEYSNKIMVGDFCRRRDLLNHRGPDSTGIFVSNDGKTALGHKRLSILDLSKNGDQPMETNDCVIVYNGEIYNFKKLKNDIKANYFSKTDTEVILRGYIKYGLGVFEKLDGMFALAIYDKKRNEIIIARDRFGIKPLYYCAQDGFFQFASETRALNVRKEINLQAVEKYLYQNYIYGEESIIKNVNKLPAGHYGVFDINKKSFAIHSYWKRKFNDAFHNNSNYPIIEEECHNILKESVKNTLVSDVPVGVFLSSGTDSSLITAISREFMPEIRAFTIAFEDKSYDESKEAKEIAKILKIKSHIHLISKNDALTTIPGVFEAFDQPSGNSSAISTYLLSKIAREKTKVCLSGDGADELFGGYPIYYLPRISGLYKIMPGKSIVESIINQLPTSFKKMSLDYKLKHFVRAAKYDYKKAHFYYRKMNNQGVLKKEFASGLPDDFNSYFENIRNQDILTQLLYVDQNTILKDDYLARVDQMSMANNLEVRVPFLNNKIADFSYQLHSNFKIRHLTTKFILKKILEKYLPKKYIYNKKKGFNLPIGIWLRQELKPLMTDILNKKNIEQIGIFDYSRIENLIKSHLGGKNDYNRELWGLISLVQYLNKNKMKI